MKKIIALALTLILFCSVVAVAERTFAYQPYNDEPLTFTIVFQDQATNTTTQEEKWFWQFCKQYLNVEMQTEGVVDAAERMTLMFAANELPDVIWGFSFTPNQLVEYGTVSGQLLALEDYITPELTPNIYALKEECPEVFAAATAPDGHMYTIPGMTYIDTAYGDTTLFARQDWLAEVGMESPTTLDEFIDVLYAFKEAELGGSETVPLGGSSTTYNPSPVILHALGFDGGGEDGASPAVLNGEAVIPAGNELFYEYLKLMNQFYTDGIISSDFYTMSDTKSEALMAEQQIGFLTGIGDDFTNWYAVQPFTSEWSETPVCPGPGYFTIGNFVMSSKCEKVEEILRFVDYMYTDEGAVLSSFGPNAITDADILLGFGGWYIRDTRPFSVRYVDVDDAENLGGYGGQWDYRIKNVFCFTSDKIMDRRHIEAKCQERAGLEAVGPEFDVTMMDRYARKANLEVIAPYYTVGYPKIVWMNEEDTVAIADLKIVIEQYIHQETAKFITGTRPLDEFEDYLDELNKLGFQEYQQYYIDAYETYLANM